MKEKIVKRYILKNGKIPFDEWFFSLDKSDKNKAEVRIKRASMGLYGKYRNLSCGITELKFENGIRIYFSEVENVVLLLLCGGNKTRQSDDIQKAQKYLEDYKERNKEQ